MREVKFRVWDKVLKKMFTPQAISFDRKSSIPFAVSVPGKSWEPIGKFELMQWTGFTDADGMDVYEEDLVQIRSEIYKVIWAETLLSPELIEVQEGSSKLPMSEVQQGRVIGNQFQVDPNSIIKVQIRN